jgi:hemerythrin-like domain-containing protein
VLGVTTTSRLFIPTVGQACHQKGSVNMSTKSIKHLKTEHERILLAVDVLRSMIEQVETNGIVREDAVELLDFLQSFSCDYHEAKERDLLFPALIIQGTSSTKTALEHLALDHEQTYEALREMREALSKDTAEFVDAATAYIDLVTTHIFAEDRLLFQGVEEWISSDVDERILNSFESFRPQLREDSRIRFDDIFFGLGRKYAVSQCV